MAASSSHPTILALVRHSELQLRVLSKSCIPLKVPLQRVLLDMHSFFKVMMAIFMELLRLEVFPTLVMFSS
jgi:3-methyladenine DNA glycosylase AlkC